MAIVEQDLGLIVGAQGPAGHDAVISSATGVVTPGHKSDPTVSVTVGGELGAQTLDFTFDGIQGSDASVPIATTGTAGKVKPDGKSIRITTDGTISVDTVAVATTEVAGTVKPDGETISVDTQGTIKVAKIPSDAIDGEIPLSKIPQGALERVVTVTDESSRFELTTDSVQLGDIVRQSDTGTMYVVVDESKLSSPEGYAEFTAGTATKATEATHAESADKLGSTSEGSSSLPVYFENGVPKPVTKVSSSETADKLGSDTVGSETLAIYLDNGVPKVVNKVAASAESDHSATADKLSTPVKINGIDFDGSSEITIKDDTKLPLTGGSITGALKVSGNINGNYLVGTWLQTTNTTRLSSAPDRYPVLDSSGWLYYRNVDDMKSDLDIVTKSELPELLSSNIETIREALGIVTKTQNGLVPKLPE